MDDLLIADLLKAGAKLRYGVITPEGKVKPDGEGPLEVTPPGLVAQPYQAGRTVAILRMGASTLVAGYVGGTPELVAGTDYQTPLVAGTDYQTPLVAGTDYQRPIVLMSPSPNWNSQNSWSLVNNANIFTYGKMVSITGHQKSPGSPLAMGPTTSVITALIGNAALKPPIEVTFAWRAFSNYTGVGSFNTSGQVVLGCPASITLPASTTVMYTINFIKP